MGSVLKKAMSPPGMLRAAFFRRDPVTCARELVGTELVWGDCAGIVVETEAYHAIGDEACHAFFRPSIRAFLERNDAGTAYVYLNYGVHWMLNAQVKGAENGFVLIRALQPTRGIELMQQRRGVTDVRQLCSGPGKLTKALQITNADDERDLCTDPAHCFVRVSDRPADIVADLRIGITRSADLPWRFTLRDSRFISRPVKRGNNRRSAEAAEELRIRRFRSASSAPLRLTSS